MFSKTFGHAVRAVTAIVQANGQKTGLQELALKLEIPQHFLGKIMQDLVRQGFIDSAKGPSGGFFINDHTRQTPIIELLKITDGVRSFNTCAMGMSQCSAEKPCPLHRDFSRCRNTMLEIFKVKTFGDMAAEVAEGQSFLMR